MSMIENSLNSFTQRAAIHKMLQQHNNNSYKQLDRALNLPSWSLHSMSFFVLSLTLFDVAMLFDLRIGIISKNGYNQCSE